MKTKSTTLLVTALLGLGVTANAVAATVYTDRALFEAAFLSTPTIETFESYAGPIIDPHPHQSGGGPNGLTSLSLDSFSLTADPQAIKIWNAPVTLPVSGLLEGSRNTTPGGSQFLYLDTDESKQGSETVFELYSSVNAFGFEYTGVFQPDDPPTPSIFTVTVNLETFNLDRNNLAGDQLFWGVIGPNFTTATLFTSLDSGYGVDDVTFGSAIPLPPALWLFGSGLLALAGSGMKKKIHS